MIARNLLTGAHLRVGFALAVLLATLSGCRDEAPTPFGQVPAQAPEAPWPQRAAKQQDTQAVPAPDSDAPEVYVLSLKRFGSDKGSAAAVSLADWEDSIRGVALGGDRGAEAVGRMRADGRLFVIDSGARVHLLAEAQDSRNRRVFQVRILSGRDPLAGSLAGRELIVDAVCVQQP